MAVFVNHKIILYLSQTTKRFNNSFELQKKLIMKARELRQSDILGGKGDNCPGNVRYVWVKIEKHLDLEELNCKVLKSIINRD